MPGYFLDNEIGATYLVTKQTETAIPRPPVRPGIPNTPSSTGTTGPSSTTGGTIGRLNTASGSLHHSTTSITDAAIHSNNPVHAGRGSVWGRGGRGGYRGISSVFGRPIDLTPTGTGPRPRRDEDWQPNMEAGAAMLDAPPEIRSVPVAPSSRIPDAPPVGINRGRGGWRQTTHPRGRGKPGRERSTSSHPFPRPITHYTERYRHPPPPPAPSAAKRKGPHEPVDTLREKGLTKKQRRALRTLRDESAQATFDNAAVQARITEDEAPRDQNTFAEAWQTTDARRKGDLEQRTASGSQPLNTVNAAIPTFVRTSEKRTEQDETGTHRPISGTDPLTQVDDMLVDDVSFESLPSDEFQVRGLSRTETRDRSAHQHIDKGKAGMNGHSSPGGIAPSRHQVVSEDRHQPDSTEGVPLDTPIEERSHAVQQTASGSFCPRGELNTGSPAATNGGDQQDGNMTTTADNASEYPGPAFMYVYVMLKRHASLAPDTASRHEWKDSDSAKVDLRDPSAPQNIDEGKCDREDRSIHSQTFSPDHQIRSEDRHSQDQLNDPPMDKVTAGGKDAVINGFSLGSKGSIASNGDTTSEPPLSRVGSTQVASPLPKYAVAKLKESLSLPQDGWDREEPEAPGSTTTDSPDRPTPRKMDKGKTPLRGASLQPQVPRLHKGERSLDRNSPDSSNDVLAHTDSSRGRVPVVSDSAAQLNGGSSLLDNNESFSQLPRSSLGSVCNVAPTRANEVPQTRPAPRHRIRITTPPDISRTSTPDETSGTGILTAKVGGDGTVDSGRKAATPDANSSSNDNAASRSMPSCHPPAPVSSGLNGDVVTKTDPAAEKEESVIDDPEVVNVENTARLSGTTSFPVPSNCEARNVQNAVELNRNRMGFELEKVVELENDYKRVSRVVWAADGMAFDWEIDRESGTYRAYWPAALANRRDQWIKGLDGSNPSISLATDINPKPTTTASSLHTPAVPPPPADTVRALAAQNTLAPRDEKDDHYVDGDVDNAIAEEQMSGSQPFPMPPNCRTIKGVSQATRDQNRAEFVRQQKVQLENACRRVKRVFWRDDGCALDWQLDYEKGVYREYWPSGRPDNLWAAGAVARWRAQEPDREVLSVTPQRDVLAITWKKAETVTSANVKAHVQSTAPDPEDEVEILESVAGPSANPKTSGLMQMPPTTNALNSSGTHQRAASTEMPLASSQLLPPAAASLPLVTSLRAISQFAPGASSSPQQVTYDQPEVPRQTDTVASSLPLNERLSEAQQEASSIETQLASYFETCRRWYHIREKTNDSVERAIVQERMDKLAERIEMLMSRQSTLQEMTPSATDR
ncbi:hypothetical protein QFC21_005184 [Naganishia friedmannii]|uniref:Uncharacterized protein n=1 Tax=Naganishia friedmannii TaxID=89922 RepID=A0ACC2VBB2_9TREE|nr:hypothetical protein QFC21_005184 [Naganishia friedmannii]